MHSVQCTFPVWICWLGCAKFLKLENYNAGVPQRSTFGPFVFLLFINDIENEVLNNNKMFVGDSRYTSLYCVVDNNIVVA